MSNTLITPSVIASSALETLYNNAVIAQLVHRDYDSDFTGKQGDTITVRKPAVFSVNEFSRPSGITVQDATEGSFTVQLTTIPDVSFPVTSEELTLELDQFEERLLTPAAEAIAQYIDAKLAELLIDTAEGAGGGGTVTMSSVASDVFTGQLGAVAKLNGAKMPPTNRSAVLGAAAHGVALADTLFVQADKSGSTDGLRDASLGRVFGFDTYMSQVLGVGSGDKGQADGVAFHRSAVTLVTRTLAAPMGLAPNQVATLDYKGFGLRVVQDYDTDQKQDVVSVDLLIGCKAQEGREAGVVQLNLGIGS